MRPFQGRLMTGPPSGGAAGSASADSRRVVAPRSQVRPLPRSTTLIPTLPKANGKTAPTRAKCLDCKRWQKGFLQVCQITKKTLHPTQAKTQGLLESA